MAVSKKEAILFVKKIYWFLLNKFRRARRFWRGVILGQGLLPGIWYELVMRPFWFIAYKRRKPNSLLPKVTIIMPVYNVEDFVADSIRSARAQSYPNIEIIAVNDGSTDGSLAILERFAESTPELKIHSKKNNGLGAARNTGVSLAKDADYIMFMDSDDTLPRRAVERMMKMALESGSDFVVGRTMRFEGLYKYERRDTAPFFRIDRQAITIRDNAYLLGDVISCNKLFRKRFWDRMKFEFPVGVVYEDMTLIVNTYLSARHFDLIAKPVYNWRLRGEGQSLSKRRAETKNLQDRLLSMEQIVALLKQHMASGRIGQEVLTQYLTRIVSLDLQLFVNYIPMTDDEFFAAFKWRSKALLADAPDEVWEKATGGKLETVRYALSHDRSETVAFIASLTGASK